MTADLILKSLLAANLAAAGAVVLMLLARVPLRKAFGARIAYAAWLAVPLAALATLLPARTLPLPSAPVGPVAEAAVVFLVQQPSFDWASAYLALWAIGAILLLAAVAATQWRAVRLIGRLKPEGRFVRAANPAIGPAILGFIKPRIILPADFERRFAQDEQMLILAHEQAHLASHDVRINALIEATRCLSWFNPLVHLAVRLIRIDQELACDAAVIARFPNARRAYAEALLKTQTVSAPLPVGCYWPPRSAKPLKQRIGMLTLQTPGRKRRVAGASVITLLAVAGAVGAWAAKPPEFRNNSAGDTLVATRPTRAEDWPARDKPLPPGAAFIGTSIRGGQRVAQWRDARGVVRSIAAKADDVDDQGKFRRWVIGIDPKTGERASFPPGASAFPEPRSLEAEARVQRLPPVGAMTVGELGRIQEQQAAQASETDSPAPLRFSVDSATYSERDGLMGLFGRVEIRRLGSDQGGGLPNLSQISADVKSLVIRCQRDGEAEAVCETSGPADPALIERLKSRIPPTGPGDAVFLLRRP